MKSLTCLSLSFFLLAFFGCSDSSTSAKDFDPDSSIESSSDSFSDDISSSSIKPSSSSEAIGDIGLNSSSSLVQSSSSEISIPSSSSEISIPSSSSSKDSPASTFRNRCLEIVNSYRALEDVAPLSLASEAMQTCADEQAALDLAGGTAHAHMAYCKPKAGAYSMAQNTAPSISVSRYPTQDTMLVVYNKLMYDEKLLIDSGQRDPNKQEDYSYIGHYLNMMNVKYSYLACGIAYNADSSKAWININFYNNDFQEALRENNP